MDEEGPNTQVSYSFVVYSASPNTSVTDLHNKFILDSGNGEMSCLAINHEYGYHNIILQVTASDAGTNPGPLNSTVFVNITIEVSILCVFIFILDYQFCMHLMEDASVCSFVLYIFWYYWKLIYYQN